MSRPPLLGQGGDYPVNRRPLLEILGISKRFPGVVALDSVSLDVRAGEVVGLVGENGAGKSTLMKILAGIYTPDSGEIQLGGKSVLIRSPREATRLGIGIIHQELEVVDNLDVAGNIFLGRELTRLGPMRLIDRNGMYAETETYLSRLGLNLSPRILLRRLSIAQQQLVEIARAFSLKSRLLIMDEPTSSLTSEETDRLFNVIRSMRTDGVSFIYISHRLAEIETLVDRVFVLRDGKNAGLLERPAITKDRMVRLMVGRDLKSYYESAGSTADGVCLQIDNLRTRRYPSQQVSLTLRRGEILGVAGLIGAGRSELAEAICGVTPAISGTISLDGESLKVESPSDAIRHGVYLIPEDRRRVGVILTMNVRENITLPALAGFCRAGLIDRRKETESARKISADLRVRMASLDSIAKNLSGGNQQKVVLAKWLSLKPRVILFDEPTKGIDIGAKAEIYHLLRQLAREGVGIMMISSDLEEILANSDRVAVMHEGRITGVLDRVECSPESIMRLAAV
jgi:ribose transport system ATP-binding protein